MKSHLRCYIIVLLLIFRAPSPLSPHLPPPSSREGVGGEDGEREERREGEMERMMDGKRSIRQRRQYGFKSVCRGSRFQFSGIVGPKSSTDGGTWHRIEGISSPEFICNNYTHICLFLKSHHFEKCSYISHDESHSCTS